MYQLIWNNLFPLYDPRDSNLRIREPEVHLAVGEAGEITFTIDPDHPYASRLARLKGVLALQADGRVVFRGRIRKDTQYFNLSREITAEGLLACLNDSLIPPFKFPEDFRNKEGYAEAAAAGKLPEFFLTWLLYEHNAQVGEVQKIQLGEVTVTAAYNSFDLESTDYAPAMEIVRKLEGVLGGYLLPDYAGLPTVLHYYADLPLSNVQEVEFGSNLLDLVSELDSTETHTAILPLGKDGLTIESLADGEISPGIWKAGRVVYSQEVEDEIGGRITRKVEWSEVLNASELRDMAAAMLTGEGVKTAETITIKAVDLGSVEDLPRFVVGRKIRLISGPHGYSRLYPLMELNPDIMDPSNTEITLCSTAATVSGLSRETRQAAQAT